MFPADTKRDAKRDSRLLDAIAIALTTGKPGDVFAAAFDRRQHIELVLAKNGLPTLEDIAAADELMSLIGDPAVQNWSHIFSFLIKRCGANINKRIHKLHMSIHETRDDFTSVLQTYTPNDDVRSEFPRADTFLEDYKDAAPSFSTVLADLVGLLTEYTTQGLNPEDAHSSLGRYEKLYLFAKTLRRSRVLKAPNNNCGHMDIGRMERAQRFKLRLRKVCQYVSNITNLVERAKRFLTVGLRILILVLEKECLTFAMMPVMLCRVDSSDLHCRRTPSTGLACAFDTSKATGQHTEPCTQAFTLNYASSSTSARRPQIPDFPGPPCNQLD
jgi:hypothetical protein